MSKSDKQLLIVIAKPAQFLSLTSLAFARFSMKTKVKFLFSMYSSLTPAYNHEKSCVSCTLQSSEFV